MKEYKLSPVFSAHNKVVVLEQTTNKVRIGLVNYNDFELRKKIEKSFETFNSESNTKFLLEFAQITEELCSKITSLMLSTQSDFFVDALQTKSLAKELSVAEAEADYSVLESPAVNFLNAAILEALEKGASDIHFEPNEHFSAIRLRLDGTLSFYKEIDNSLYKAVCRRIKLLSNLEITDSHKIQDGEFSFEKGNFSADIRVSTVPVWNGEAIVLRLLRKNNSPLKLEDLGFNRSQLETIKNLISKRNSLIVVCGSTGDGKTTTLAAMITEIQKSERKIITIENPVEYKLAGVTQIEVNQNLNLDFANILPSCFRQDPDVIMIGEIRDEKTAEIAVRAALTGHLVLATLHGADCCTAINRLLDLKVRPFLLASVLGATIAQHLVAKETGGRKAVAEILESSVDVRQMIIEEAPSYKFAEYMQQQNLPRIEDFLFGKETNMEPNPEVAYGIY